MRSFRSLSFFLCIAFGLLPYFGHAQQRPLPASEIKLGLEKLDVLGSVLYLAAHPDDENTRLISWMANEKKFRTSYMSLTRGDGGQNLIGTEMGVELGLIRTNELLAARSVDGGEQYFSSAYDFGFSKTPAETLSIWNEEATLGEVVYMIRKLRPDVIINRFPPDKRGGHGHHQSSAILAAEAFAAAGDPNRFPEQLNRVSVWQPRRLFWNSYGDQHVGEKNVLSLDIGAYMPLLGMSIGEMASLSRSQHKSQGFGSATSRGKSLENFILVAGDQPQATPFDSIDTGWGRLPNTAGIQKKVQQLNREFSLTHPEKSIPGLIALHRLVQQLKDPYWKEQKTREIERLLLSCAGIYADSFTGKAEFVPGEKVEIQQEITVQNPSVTATIVSIDGEHKDVELAYNTPYRGQYNASFQTTTQPYWLRKPQKPGKFDIDPADYGRARNADAPSTVIVVSIDGHPITLALPIGHKYVDPVRGEMHQPLRIVPQLTASTQQRTMLLRGTASQTLSVTFTNNGSESKLPVTVQVPDGVSIVPSAFELDFSEGKSVTKAFDVRPKQGLVAAASISFSSVDGPVFESRVIEHEHIPTLSWFPEFGITLQPVAVEVPVKKVAYIMGAGDKVPEALRAVGIEVDLITAPQLVKPVLAQYDAVVFGVRAYNTHPELFAHATPLFDYVKDGGVALVQYNVNNNFSKATGDIGPYPFEISRSRVTEEDAEITFALPDDPALNRPNKIGPSDFGGWVQERGLYFTEKVDPQYRMPLAMHDKDEEAHTGSLLVTRYGKGKFVYTSLSFFRQLPAGVPGAYRLFLNLLAKEN